MNLLYNGKELDAATGLYYYGARYYDPRTSIFQSVDSLVKLTLQPYQYAYNNPVMFHDPTGLRGEPKSGGDWPPKRWNKFKNWISSTGTDQNIRTQDIEEVKLYKKAKPNGNFFSDFFNGPIQKPIEGVNTVQVTKNTLITYRANQRPIYQFILPQNFGGWSEDDKASDGLIYKGCLSYYSVNGAYTFASHNSREAEIGSWGALAIMLAAQPGSPIFGGATKGVTRSLDNLSSLEGATWNEAKSSIPKDWISGPIKKGEGIKFVNPAKKGEQILLEKGWPGAKDPLHAGPYMKVSRDGKITRIPLQGNPTLK